ncbi:hypothetical protein [Capnocytophaga canis]|uniref:Uncharacterized protein n=1 Tax=Capnocytophaga canis TaxID=1848903 RepID=A0A0B7IWS1_9FLAO|nr:hypothetical protein [Capnocytophaga canis]GIM62001.1 hypothetical protein CAPN008_20510 [Capnocytophaga canis]CEN54428.1 conserved hypothetical protein [Capnocytophaga canis]
MEKNYKEYFKVLLPNAKVYFPKREGTNVLGHTQVDLSDVPHNAFQLYVTGFPHLALHPEASELFESYSESGLKELIKQKKNSYPDDVPILKKALELKKSKKP